MFCSAVIGFVRVGSEDGDRLPRTVSKFYLSASLLERSAITGGLILYPRFKIISIALLIFLLSYMNISTARRANQIKASNSRGDGAAENNEALTVFAGGGPFYNTEWLAREP